MRAESVGYCSCDFGIGDEWCGQSPAGLKRLTSSHPSHLISSHPIIEVGSTESGMIYELGPFTSRLGVNISTRSGS